MGERVILHSDCNNFYASVECLYRPELRGKPVAVCGDPEKRHGIILAKNNLAKAKGIMTGNPIWLAKELCPDLVLVPPNYSLYIRFSRMARAIYADYTDLIEPFGMDEAWLDVTGSTRLYGSGEEIAQKIRKRIKTELGITVSVGVSWNKIFAKLGSDLEKPDAVTVINKGNFKDKVWPLPTAELLYVGKSTQRRLAQAELTTIGQLANTDRHSLKHLLGKWGEMLWVYANGLEQTPVMQLGEEAVIKSIGNGTTTPRDIVSLADAKITMRALSESVAARLREQGLACTTVQISIRDTALESCVRQMKLARPTQVSTKLYATAMQLLSSNHDWERPLRSLGVRGMNLVTAYGPQQIALDIFDEVSEDKGKYLEGAIDDIRNRFGHYAIQRAIMLTEPDLVINPQEHINPVRPD